MENRNENTANENYPLKSAGDEKTEFENPSVDPGFQNSGDDKTEDQDQLEGQEDERENNIDANQSIKDMQSDNEEDALNYKSDRENGAYNPKNI